MPYPGGNMDIYIMSRVPGVPVGLIVAVLEDEHLRIIRTQLTNILEYGEVILRIYSALN